MHRGRMYVVLSPIDFSFLCFFLFLDLLDALKHAGIVLGAALVVQMALDVFVAEETTRVDVVEHADKVVEAWVELAQVLPAQRVRFRPMRPAFVACENGFEAFKELPVRHVQAIRSIAHKRSFLVCISTE